MTTTSTSAATTATDLILQGTDRYNAGDAEGFCALYADDVVLVTPEGRFEGRDAATAYVRAQMAGFPDAVVSIGRHVESAGTYFGEFAVHGTNTGPMATPDGQEIPATGRAAQFPGMEIAEVRDGRIVRHDMMWDGAGLLVQLGLLEA